MSEPVFAEHTDNAGTVIFDVDTDGGSESTNPTRAQCVAAQKIAWAAYCDNYVVLN